MLKIIYLCVFSLAAVLVSGDLIVLHHPSSLEVTENTKDKISPNLLIDIYTGVLGYTAKLFQEWNGIKVKDVFDLPKAVVNIVIEGVPSIGMSNVISYPLSFAKDEEEILQGISNRLLKREYFNSSIRINAAAGFKFLEISSLGQLTRQRLEGIPSELADNVFIEEIEILQAISRMISNMTINQQTEIYWFVVSGLKPFLNNLEHEADEKKYLALLRETIYQLTTLFVNLFDGKVFVSVLINEYRDPNYSTPRVRRQAVEGSTTEKSAETNSETYSPLETSETRDEENEENNFDETSSTTTSTYIVEINTSENTNIEYTESSELNNRRHEIHSIISIDKIKNPLQIKDINLAPKYSADYPAIFNIILWFGVIMVFSLIAICVAIADMDPGRDSIIYRMTSNRMKKDN